MSDENKLTSTQQGVVTFLHENGQNAAAYSYMADQYPSGSNEQQWFDSASQINGGVGPKSTYAGVANTYTAPTDPAAWSVHKGKLYLNFSRAVRARWALNKRRNIEKADANWPAVLG